MRKATTKASVIATLKMVERLREKFPLTFCVPPKPLKIGIYYDLCATLRPDYKGEQVLGFALEHLTTSPEYLRACVEGVPRVDLSGNESGKVEDWAAKYACEKLAKRTNNKEEERHGQEDK